MKKFLYLMLFIFFTVPGISQEKQPPILATFDYSQGVHIYSYDSIKHRDKKHYEKLLQITCEDLNVTLGHYSVELVFLDKNLFETLRVYNQTRFSRGDIVGQFITPNIIMMRTEAEQDDTFIHECIHYLIINKAISVDNEQSEEVVAILEAEVVFSRAYLDYIKTVK